MKSTIKLVVEAYYSRREDVMVAVDSDGIISVRIPDPAGSPDMELGYTFGPMGCKAAVCNHYETLQEAIKLVDDEVAVAPDIRRNILHVLGY